MIIWLRRLLPHRLTGAAGILTGRHERRAGYHYTITARKQLEQSEGDDRNE